MKTTLVVLALTCMFFAGAQAQSASQSQTIKARAAKLRSQSAPSAPAATVAQATSDPSMSATIRDGMKKHEQNAYYLARAVVQESLKNPNSAKFSTKSDPNTGIVPYGFYQWHAFGKVDAQNSFGATTREHWEAVVKLDAGKLRVIWCRLGDSQSGPKPAVAVAPRLASSAPAPAATATNRPAPVRGKKAENTVATW